MKDTIFSLMLALQLSVNAVAQQPAATPAPAPNPPLTDPRSDAPQTRRPQRESSDDDVVRITTNLVQVDAVITDNKGQLVTDLLPEEVEILEDGKAQKITNFSFVPLEPLGPAQPVERKVDKSAPPLPPVRLRPEQVRRTIALVVDDLGLSFESMHYVRQALRKFLEQQMREDDLVAIIRTGGGIGALQQFTSDKRQLYAAVEKVKWNPIGRGRVAAFAPISSDPLANLASNVPATIAAQQSSVDLDEFREEIFAVGTLGALNYIVRGLRELPGRKSVLLISDGFPLLTTGDPTGNTRILTSLQRLTDLANRASVVIYTMDARGLQILGLTSADSTGGMTVGEIEQQLSTRRSRFFDSQSGLNYLAQQTGGLAIRNNNDLSGGIRRVLEDHKGYYLIGYRPDDSTFDPVSGRRKFHKLSLKIKRPGKFKIRMRNGFFGISEENAVAAQRTPQQQLLSALASPFGASDVTLKLTSLFGNDPEVGSYLRSLLHVEATDLTFTEEAGGWHQAVFEIIAVTFGDNGTVIDEVSRVHTIRARGETYDQIVKHGFVYNLTVPLKKAGAYQLRAALRDQGSGRVGSASQFVEVPDIKKNRLSVSGIIIRGVPFETYNRPEATSSTQEANVDGAANTSAGAAVRRFKQRYVLEYGVVIYNGQIDKISGKSNIQTQARLFHNGQPIFVGKELPLNVEGQTDLKRLTASGALQLGTDMAPGDYVFQIVVTDLLAKEKHRTATQWMDFEIVK